MNFRELRKFQQREKHSQLQELPDTFYVDVSEYCNLLKENEDYVTFNNVLSIVDTIKHQRLNKLFNIAIGYVYQSTQEEDLDKLSEVAPNMISCEVALFRDIVIGLRKYDHYLFQECSYLQKK